MTTQATLLTRFAPIALSLLTLAVGCDTDAAAEHGDSAVEASSRKLELVDDFQIEYTIARVGPELSITLPGDQVCQEGETYKTETTETAMLCISGEIVEMSYTRIDFFACKDGAWSLEFSACANDGCSPKFEPTGEPCDSPA